MKLIRIATRASLLARRQAESVAQLLRQADGTVRTELVAVPARADRHLEPPARLGGKGVFTRRLQELLRRGEADLAVHSAKDLPTDLPRELPIAAVPCRGDPRDALVGVGAGGAERLRPHASVGTSSLRRRAQLLARRGDLRIVPLRGNVQTRLRKVLEDKSLDAAVMAMAGLQRSGLLERYAEHVHPLGVEVFVPAAGQGALAVQVRKDSCELLELLARIDHRDSHAALDAERWVVSQLGADCGSAVGVCIRPIPGGWEARGFVGEANGECVIRHTSIGTGPGQAAADLLEGLSSKGARRLLGIDRSGS